MASKRVCSIPDCGKPVHGHGWCHAHHERWRKHGDPLHIKPNSRQIDITGQVFSKLTALRPVADGNVRKWECRCDCGNITVVRTAVLRNGHTTSCGCHKQTVAFVHGMTGSREYRAWQGMQLRCYDTKGDGYDRYGGRGIAVCDRWKGSLANFIADMGEHPGMGYSLDRIDNDGNYEPSNCRWATSVEQCNNRSVNRLVTAFGETDTVANMYRRFSPPVSRPTLRSRLRRGWDPDLAFTVPPDSPQARRIDKGLRTG